jgi:hypothetical protein
MFVLTVYASAAGSTSINTCTSIRWDSRIVVGIVVFMEIISISGMVYRYTTLVLLDHFPHSSPVAAYYYFPFTNDRNLVLYKCCRAIWLEPRGKLNEDRPAIIKNEVQHRMIFERCRSKTDDRYNGLCQCVLFYAFGR